MIKKIIRKLLPKSNKNLLNALDFGIQHKLLPKYALKSVQALQDAGFEAYIVGGAVRDLLAGLTPKDFDIATNATPDEVRKVFRRGRIVGKRFPIVILPFGAELLEITTFRSNVTAPQNEQGRIMRDTAFGTRKEDARRRDFTCNALYYDPVAEKIADDIHGIADIQARRLVMIGEPDERFHEDPVRMLRAARLSAKLGFSLSAEIENSIRKNSFLLKNEPPARLFDEITKELLCGNSSGCLKNIKSLNIPADIHPIFAIMTTHDDDSTRQFVQTVLQRTDERVKHKKPVSIAFVLAALFWHKLQQIEQDLHTLDDKPTQTLHAAIRQIREDGGERWGVPNRLFTVMREIWQLQPQFAYIRGKRPFRLLKQPSFRAAYDFYVLRSLNQDADPKIAEFWTKFQAANEEQRNAMTQPAVQKTANKKRRRRKPKKDNQGTENEP
ncbi:MAG: polynucleotide adenylyltransferase PcnB [Neisseriaceae bacterium]|nr:polynucleotide adenylyltransferase PcnB [Neisseriaceae bacterium]